MDYSSRIRLERAVIGGLLSEYGYDGFYAHNKHMLKKELFYDAKNRFIFSVLERMYAEGAIETTPHDILLYANEHGIKYGNMNNFAVYMCELANEYDFRSMDFKEILRRLIGEYIKEKRNG